jgi:hypothetical protein
LLADVNGADLDGTSTALMIRVIDEESGETARLNEPHAGDLSNGPAKTSLVREATPSRAPFVATPCTFLVA